MFGRNSESESSSPEGAFTPTHDVSAFVGEGVQFKGVINYQGTVRIDGQLEGEVHTAGVLIVGQGAVIKAKVEAGTIICKGKIVGDIVAREKIQLMSPAVLNGSIKTPSLSMEEDVLFNGSCEMGPVRTKSSDYSGSDGLKAV
mgnify:CR=1 FL=1